MAVPCTIVASGGFPVSEAISGTPFTPTTDAFPVTIVANGGMPVVFVSDTGVLMPGGGSGPTGSGILLEDDASLLLAEGGAYLILEQA